MKASTMECLPLEISLNILLRLPIISLFNCKRVCKAWRHLVHNPHLPFLHQAYYESQNNPCLILHAPSNSIIFPEDHFYVYPQDDLYLVDCNGQGLVKRIKLPFKYCKFTSVLYCNGLLCLVSTETCRDIIICSFICIFNLFTQEFKILPDPTMTYECQAVYGFGFDSRTKDYKVARGVKSSKQPLDQRVEVLTLGINVWRLKGSSLPFWITMQQAEALVKGALHWFGQQKDDYMPIIVAFDLGVEEFHQIPPPPCRFNEIDGSLMVLDGFLSIGVSHLWYWDNIDVWLMKDYGVKEILDQRIHHPT